MGGDASIREGTCRLVYRPGAGRDAGIVLKLVVGSILRTTLSGVAIGPVGGLVIAKGIGP
jgi:hypothetical protein